MKNKIIKEKNSFIENKKLSSAIRYAGFLIIALSIRTSNINKIYSNILILCFNFFSGFYILLQI